jgi:replicative DNA helicase
MTESKAQNEATLLGCFLADNNLIDKAVASGLTKDHFVEPWQVIFFDKAVRIRAKGGVVDIASLAVEGVPYADAIVAENATGTSLPYAAALEKVLWAYSKKQIDSLCLQTNAAIKGNGTSDEERRKVALLVSQMQAWIADKQDTSRTCEEIGAEVEQWAQDLIDGKPDNRVKVEWPLPSMNERFGPIMPHELCCIGARPKQGKAQPLTAKILTPDGWLQMGDISVGQYVIGLDGKPTRVVGVYPQGKKKVYRVTLTDGCSTECCEEHLWLTETRNERKSKHGGFSVKTTRQIIDTLKRKDYPYCHNHVIPWYQPVEFSESESNLPLHPWLLGALIGDGGLTMASIKFTKPEKDVLDKVLSLLPESDTSNEPTATGDLRIRRIKRNNTASDTKKIIDKLGLSVTSEFRFIPPAYLRAKISDRILLLQGLVDTDGHIAKTVIDFSTSSERLKNDVLDLCRGLGLGASWVRRITKFTAKDGSRRDGLPSYRIKIKWRHSHIVPFSSQKHLSKFTVNHDAPWHRSIDSIVESGESECQCISVESHDSIYITDDFIPTHNTAAALQLIGHNLKRGLKMAYFTMETSDSATLKMIASQMAQVDLRNVARETRDKQQDFLKYVKKLRASKNLAIFEKDMNILKIEARCRMLSASMKPDFIIIDHLHLVQNDFGEKQYEKVTDTVNRLIELRKHMGCALILCLQLNRGPENSERAPRASDARDSGAIEAAAHRMVIPYRPPNDFNDQPQVGPQALMRSTYDYFFIQDICRDGPSGVVKSTYLAPYTIFTDCNK